MAPMLRTTAQDSSSLGRTYFCGGLRWWNGAHGPSSVVRMGCPAQSHRRLAQTRAEFSVELPITFCNSGVNFQIFHHRRSSSDRSSKRQILNEKIKNKIYLNSQLTISFTNSQFNFQFHQNHRNHRNLKMSAAESNKALKLRKDAVSAMPELARFVLF